MVIKKKNTGAHKRGRENSQCSLIKNKAIILHTPKMNSQIPGLKNYQKWLVAVHMRSAFQKKY